MSSRAAMTAIFKVCMAALCVTAFLIASSEAIPVHALKSTQNRALASSLIGSKSHNQGSIVTIVADGTTAQAVDAAAGGNINPASPPQTGVITGEMEMYKVRQDIREPDKGGHLMGKTRALLDLVGSDASSATLWAQDTTAQSIDAAANGDIHPAVAAQTGVVTGQIATYAVQEDIEHGNGGRGWVGGRRLAAPA